MAEQKILKIGDIAPLFTLEDQSGKKVALADFRHKKMVVLIFYPGDMTPGCTMQLCAVRDDSSKFAKAGAVVFGINHGDANSHKAFIKKHALPFPLLIDKGKKVSLKYGAIKSFFKTKIIKRTVVAVDKEGKIIYLRRGMPTDAEILKALK
ncbi:peroxiredoxin [Patescibacteria group bacterium]|nr:peroxiredoxin [Patescibacteria group bacterium]MBU1034651.1 peroxiredoxin [Patescibacteria group bacterium]MBU1629661.1 peroxiredoxin [Patescibacteria group bacterium]MBU1908311.1 peroxiredoxin [Patescibacteria group bacterium]